MFCPAWEESVWEYQKSMVCKREPIPPARTTALCMMLRFLFIESSPVMMDHRVQDGVPLARLIAMNIHEYQAKAMFKRAGVPVLRGVHCTSVKEALDAYAILDSKIV